MDVDVPQTAERPLASITGVTRRWFAVAVLTALVTAASPSASAQSGFENGTGSEAVAVDAAAGAATAIRLDGDLNDAAWLKAPPLTAFVQREPNEGAPPSFNTEARVVFDQSALYVAVRAYDPEPAKILGFLTRRDVESASDWLHVLIDSYHDRRTAYQFSVNPVGVKRDLYWYNDNNTDESWDAVWEVVVNRNADGWQAEFRIPYSQLRFNDGDGPLGFAVVRDVARLSEKITWPLLPLSASGWVSSFGELRGLVLPRGSQQLELVPYSVAQVVTRPYEAENPLLKTPDPGASLGLDLKYAVTSALSLTATLNPDFGQVEADPAEVNLSAFETFFAEKRPFFVEGSGTYQFGCGDGCNLFYSRRIGRTPRVLPVLDDGEYMSRPGQSTILGAGKLTGRVGSFSVGMLTAATQEEIAHRAAGSSRRTEIVEPASFYLLSRARREFSDQSSLGFIVTTTKHREPEPVSSFADMALSAATDYDWRLGRRWGLNGYLAASRVTGSASAIADLQQSNVHSYQRPDAEHVEFDPLAESLNGHAGSVSFGKIAGQRTRMNVSLGYKSPGFDLNEAGFLRRADEIPQNSWLQVRWDTPGKYVRTVRINFNQWSNHNFDGDRLSLGGNFNAHWTFQNLWNTGFGVNLNARSFDDRKTRGGPGGYGNRNINSWQYFNTNNRLKVSFRWDSFLGSSGEGGSEFNVQPGVTFRPVPAFSAELTFYYQGNLNDDQWVEAVTGGDRTHYVFGRLNQSTSSITARLNYTLTPNLSVQLYGQPFVSAGRYENYKELVDGRAGRHRDRYAPFAYDDNADFNVLSFRTTNVLRWEFKPGSAFFVIWQQGREGLTQRGNFRFGRDFGDVFATPSTNTLLVKLAYWINP